VSGVIRAAVPDIVPWDAVASRYASPVPGLADAVAHQVAEAAVPVDVLLRYDAAGDLAGVLHHYPEGFPLTARPGAVEVWVRPDARGLGHARLLWVEAKRRWGIDWRDSEYTPEGARAVAHHEGLEVGDGQE
jgi:GNAT superfamily N-acetyltransferase